ncbi:MAG: TIGR00282 family metallophosphoesterase [Alphaproteobacteria bacterium]|nr:TIGR00282 family metallophosphoesterase [Alphaproteobacteria bacterium]
MRVLYCGDVVGRSGREAILAEIPGLRQRLRLDFVAVNGENAAGGFGITGKICEEFYAAGVDAITLGNHAWDQKETLAYIGGDPKLLRPHNYPKGTPGKGVGIFAAPRGRKVAIVHVMGRVFMDPLDDPFQTVEQELARMRLGVTVDFILVDIHGEATSEKMAMGHFVDGRASLVCGTHSHVPTADAQILPGGTAYQTDAGMCGDYNSVIGMEKGEPLARFTRKIPGGRFEPAAGPATLCGVYVETDDRTGLAIRIEPVRIGGRLKPALVEPD